MNRRDDDLAMLVRILRPCNAPELSESERTSFRDMHAHLRKETHYALSPKQRKWALEVDARLKPIDVANVPRGREAAVPEVLRRPLPLRPPHRRHEVP